MPATPPPGLNTRTPARLSAPRPQRRAGRYALAAIGGGVLLALLLVAALALSARGWKLVPWQQHTSADLLPSDTLVYGTLTVLPANLPAVQELAPFFPNLLGTASSAVPTPSLAELGVTFEQDIQPWLGAEVAFAISGIPDLAALRTLLTDPADAETLRHAEVGLLLASRDDAQAQAFLTKQHSYRMNRAGQQFASTVYKSITIYEQQAATPHSPLAAFALLPGHVVFASTAARISAIIDQSTAQDDTLASSIRFKHIQSNLPTTALGFIYLDGWLITAPANQAAERGGRDLPPETARQIDSQLKNVQALDAIGLAVTPGAEGLHLDAIATLNLPALNEAGQRLLAAAQEPVDIRTLDHISQDALALATFKLSPAFHEQLLAGFNSQPGGTERIATLESAYGINLERDVFSWLVGDAALVVLPGERLGTWTFPVTAYLAIRPQDRNAAATGMQRIGTALTPLVGGLQPVTLETTSWQVIQEPFSGRLVAGYSLADEEVVVAFGSTALVAASTGSTAPITASPVFQTVSSNLPSPNGGIVYVGFPRLLETVDRLTENSTASWPWRTQLAAVQAIGLAGEPGVSANGIARARLFIQFQHNQ